MKYPDIGQDTMAYDFDSDQRYYVDSHSYSLYHDQVILAMDLMVGLMMILCLCICKLPLCFVFGAVIGKHKSKTISRREPQQFSPDERV